MRKSGSWRNNGDKHIVVENFGNDTNQWKLNHQIHDDDDDDEINFTTPDIYLQQLLFFVTLINRLKCLKGRNSFGKYLDPVHKRTQFTSPLNLVLIFCRSPAGQRSQYNDSLQAGKSGDWILVGARLSGQYRKAPRFSSLLKNGYGDFLGCKAARK